LRKVAEKQVVIELPQQLCKYLRVNVGLPVDVVSLAEVVRFPTLYYTKLLVMVAQFQGEGIQMPNI